MGFTITGLLLVAAILLPNLLFIIFPPRNTPKEQKDAGIIFTVLERIGQTGCFILPVISKSFIDEAGMSIWLILSMLCIMAYYCLWIRYMVKGREFKLLFETVAFIPVPMAVFPVLAFGLMAVWMKSPWMSIAVVLLAVGHIANSLHSYKSMKDI